MTLAPPGGDGERTNVQLEDWQTLDAGFAMIPNYWLRFWRPALAARYSHTVAALWEQLLAYTRAPDNECHPRITTLADAIGVERRQLIGRARAGREPEPGAIAILHELGLIRAERHPDGQWHFWVRRDPGILPDELLEILPAPTRNAHTAWLGAWGERTKQNLRSMGKPTPTVGKPTPTVGTPTPTVGTPTPTVGTPTRTNPPTHIHYEVEEESEHALSQTDRLVIVPAAAAALAQLWSVTVDDIRAHVPPHDWRTYVRPSRLVAISTDRATVQTPTDHAASRLRRLEPAISRALSAIVSRPVVIEYEPAGTYTT